MNIKKTTIIILARLHRKKTKNIIKEKINFNVANTSLNIVIYVVLNCIYVFFKKYFVI